MRLKSCVTVFLFLFACVIPRTIVADTPAPAGDAPSAQVSSVDSSGAWTERQAQNLMAYSEDGAHESWNLFLLGLGFVGLGVAVAAASRRQTADEEIAPGWTSMTAED